MTNASLKRLYKTANLLALITIGYNIIEGVLSVWLGAADETLSLFGFGVDSFVEVISGIGIWHMVRRIQANRVENRDDFEQQALRITGWAFYILTFGLVISAGSINYLGPSLALTDINPTLPLFLIFSPFI